MTGVFAAQRAKQRRAQWMAALMVGSALSGGLAHPAQAQTSQGNAAAQAARLRSFNIPAQALTDGLTLFGQQSGWQVAVQGNLVTGISTPGVRGAMAPQQALQLLLAGTGFTYSLADKNTVILQKLGGPEAADGTINLPPVQVEGQAADLQNPYGPGVGYVATRSETATKSDTPIIETPQTISVITRKQMDDQNVQSVPQALRYTSGVVAEQRGTNTDALEYVYNRGFQIDEYLNGLLLPGQVAGYDITSVDPYLLDRIELLQGPASVLYGQASPGGILNLTSKMPTETPLHEVMLQTGSYGRAQGAVDLSGPLNQSGTLLGRITADAYSTGTQTDRVNEQRIAIAPSVTWKPDTDTSITLFGNYQYDPEAGQYNSVPAAGTVLPGYPISRSLNVGDPSYDSFTKTEISIGYALSHRFNDVWSVNQNFRYLYDRERIQYIGADSGIDPSVPGGTSLLREPYYNSGTVYEASLDNRAQAKFATGPLTHTVSFGIDWYRTDYNHVFQSNLDGAADLNIANPVYGQPVPPLNFTFGTSGDQVLNQLGFYAQDQVRYGNWAFLSGIREDIASENSTALKTGSVTNQSNDAFTWRVGLVYLFDNGIAPYASYSTSFQPEIGTTYAGTSFQPTTAKQYEVGVKYQPPGANSFVTASLFDIAEQNVLTTDPAHTSFQVQTGEVRSRGVQLEAHAALTDNLQLIAAYTYDDLKNTKSNSSNLGKVPVGIPANMASGWLNYDTPDQFLPGLQLGGGVRYLGYTYGSTTDTFKVPAVTLVDLAVHYNLGKALPHVPAVHGLSATVSASNLLDKTYISSCLNADFCTFGEGRLVLANLKYDW